MIGSETDPDSGLKSIYSEAHAHQITDENSELNRRLREGESGLWTWAQLTHHFLIYKKPKLKKRYRKQYAHYLELGAFKAIAGKTVAELKLRDLEAVRDQILIDHAPSAAHRAVRRGKAMLSWGWKYNAAKAGLDETQYEWWLR